MATMPEMAFFSECSKEATSMKIFDFLVMLVSATQTPLASLQPPENESFGRGGEPGTI
jgi:hypothetical protein